MWAHAIIKIVLWHTVTDYIALIFCTWLAAQQIDSKEQAPALKKD